jgi:hypothetical protein
LAPVNNENGLFYIDEDTGVIHVGKSEGLDFETYKLGIHLVAIAQTDAPASVIMWGYADVWVHLSDVNDNSPVFTQKEYTATVAEGNPKGAFVIKVTAIDLDDNENSRLSYHLVDGNHDNAFVVDPTDSGIVKTNIVLDSEIRDTYKLTVIATDEGTPQMTGMATIRVIVIDINDNRPSFPPQMTINVKEGLCRAQSTRPPSYRSYLCCVCFNAYVFAACCRFGSRKYDNDSGRQRRGHVSDADLLLGAVRGTDGPEAVRVGPVQRTRFADR